MTEYIERKAALDICEKTYQECLRMSDWCGDTVAWNIGHEIKAIPAADVITWEQLKKIWKIAIMDLTDNKL